MYIHKKKNKPPQNPNPGYCNLDLQPDKIQNKRDALESNQALSEGTAIDQKGKNQKR